ncbi:MAG: adenylate/guanylate cyclase domain-containing protein, partial [Nitrososphaerales archaeon]
MACSKCGFNIPDGMKFCNECGTPVNNVCPNCNFENPSQSKFCGECGSSLSDQTTKSISKEEREAERRQLTVMFCDMVGSTALSEQLDPEELRDVIEDYQRACGDIISRHDGHIAKYLGDGLLVYFGYPMAHEDDAQRAVRAGLEIVEEIENLDSRLKKDIGLRLAVRLGIHTGLVVAGEMGTGEAREQMAIVGETPNIAARLQGLAEPNTVIISSTTHKLVEGYFEFSSLGPQHVKGISHPITVYQVLREGDVQSPFEIAIKKGLTPLVGREQEVGTLLERWEQVKENMGQVVLISGEAGIGKSRLLRVMKERLADEPHIRFENRCSPYYQNSAFYPVIDHIERLLEFSREDPAEEKLNKLEKTLERYELHLKETVPLFAPLLSIPLPDHYPSLGLTPQMQKRRTMEALIACLLEEADKQPVLYIVEDLHWVDHSTLEYLNMLVEQVPNSRIFVLLSFRPDFIPGWSMRSHFGQIILSRLAKKQVEQMVNSVSAGTILPEDIIRQIVSKTDGVPLYVEEITKMVLELELLNVENRGDQTQLPIPVSLQDSLAARLDRIASGEICGLGAALGRSFTYELLMAVSPLDETSLQRELNQLVEAEILYQRGIPPKASYLFKHVLIQEAAYQSLLKSKRRKYHKKIANTMDKKFPQIAEAHPEILAHHFAEAGQSNKAIPYWQRAGQRAVERSANVEAIGHLNKCLNM